VGGSLAQYAAREVPFGCAAFPPIAGGWGKIGPVAGTLDSEGRAAEIDTIKAFVIASRRDRWIADLDRPMLKRSKTVRLHDTRDFDSRFMEPISSEQHTPDRLVSLLRSRGSPGEVWLMSSVDVELMPLERAVAELVGRDGDADGLVICISGRLAYLQTEDDGAFVLAR
jgi:hypothetical protein